MLAKDFHIPFDFENRRAIIINRLLYIPKYYDKHSDFKDKILFENDNQVQVEYCSGNGEWIINKAIKNTNINYIAVEMRFDRARKIWVDMHNQQIKNLFVILGEALIFTKYYLEGKSVGDIYVNFPDPWPKKKHSKNRLIKDEFLIELARVMKKKSSITIVTDHKIYLEQMIEVFFQNKDFQPAFKKPYFVEDQKDFGSSFFKRIFSEKGKSINYLKFIR